jgi:hypothetical protein
MIALRLAILSSLDRHGDKAPNEFDERFGLRPYDVPMWDDRIKVTRLHFVLRQNTHQSALARVFRQMEVIESANTGPPHTGLLQQPAVVGHQTIIRIDRFPTAQPVHHHRASYPGIEFHCEHPSSLSMPFKGIEAA